MNSLLLQLVSVPESSSWRMRSGASLACSSVRCGSVPFVHHAWHKSSASVPFLAGHGQRIHPRSRQRQVRDLAEVLGQSL
ncbi:hypothetical protein Y1Q_0020000 [Alligator mississippiensis]|uniref:Uncharacterized protein n=1 Tax=Alligator mississippiensis TaxID=8496 RepID=A0A151LYM1_ALLMI|nr:hypothetical protein Y1Q_0020000 [Alligator mississippiensis]